MTLDNLSNGDPTKWDYYYKLKVIAFLNLLAYYKEKQEAENARIRLEQMKRGK